MSSSIVQYHGGRGKAVQPRGEAEEEWVTTKKVEIVTTKNVERKIQRQVVLEDGRVVEEEIPTVTVDTTEDKQTFETDQDEERNLEGKSNLASKFDTSGGVLVGDKFTSRKKTNDVRENLVKTEAMQDLGNIRSKDIKKVLEEKDDIRNYLRGREGPNTQVSVAPRTVFRSRNHKVVTDKEDVQERNWVNKGKMQNERIKTEEHIEYDSDDSPDDGSTSSSSKSSHHKLEPEVYKTRKDENFTEYFKIGKENNNKPRMVKVGDGPHYVSESKEVQREDDNHLSHQSFRPTRTKQMPRHLLAEIDASNHTNKKPVNRTDSWLERHFGSTSSLSASSTELSRPGSREGYGLRRSASICDIRPVDSSRNDFYATVRKSGKVSDVRMREKKQDNNNYAANRVSANFSSSGHPVRPPRRTKKPEYEEFIFTDCLKKSNQAVDFPRQNNSHSNRSQSAHVTEKYYYGNPVTVRKTQKAPQVPNVLHKSFSSVQHLERSTPPGHYQSTGNLSQISNNRKDSSPRERSSISSRHIRSVDVHQVKNNLDINSNRQNERKVPKRDDRQLRNYSDQSDSRQSVAYSDKVNYSTPKEIRQMQGNPPHKIIYTTDSPSAKYRTKIVINGDE